ncbi:MAG TPA: hypothetical protein VFE61_05845 [Candidatus Sulfotelmatobacter sp.]|jgi:quercetin dioxygenase-like cupin family protein|nr:hypothetical protein [Candidatus Sulfotelmatobacter sp.]
MRSIALLLFLAALLSAQSAPEVEITAEPHHHLVFANDQVRIFNVEVPPHTDTAMHRHLHDYLYVQLGNAEVINAVKGKDPVTVKLQDGQVGFLSASYSHVARNQTDQPFHNVTIELLQDEKLRHASSKRDEDRGLNVLQGGTKEILFVKDGIRVSEVELQPGGVMPLPDHPGPILFVALSDLTFRAQQIKNQAHSAWADLDRKRGDSVFVPATPFLGWRNVGHSPNKFVTLEFP